MFGAGSWVEDRSAAEVGGEDRWYCGVRLRKAQGPTGVGFPHGVEKWGGMESCTIH